MYDDLGRLISSIDSELNENDFEYDNLGRLVSETSPQPSLLGGEGVTTISYEYDVNNNLTKIIHPDLRETEYSYDALNRNTTVSFS
ncbi:MAG: RHS repeat protein [Cytophagales bacterium]|nr:RHS repeat protein [Cytophagales bacterium]